MTEFDDSAYPGIGLIVGETPFSAGWSDTALMTFNAIVVSQVIGGDGGEEANAPEQFWG